MNDLCKFLEFSVLNRNENRATMTSNSALINFMSRPHFCGIAVLLILCAITSTQTAAQRVIAVQTPQFHRDYLWYSCNFMEYRPDQSEDPSLAAVEAKVSSNQKAPGIKNF